MTRNSLTDGEFVDGMPFFGGWLWIDLLNSTMRSGAARRDLIDCDSGYMSWLKAAGLDAEDAQVASRQRAQLTELRDVLRQGFEIFRAGKPLPDAMLARINARLATASIRLSLERGSTGLRLVETLNTGRDGASAVIAADFARFVCEAEPQRLRHCSNPACTMVFYDTSKNGTRRWCSMSICGNRDKVARFRARKADGIN